jgi:hypothetical protein
MTASCPHRGLHELGPDESGQLTAEWVLLTGTVIIPLGMLGPVLISTLVAYFYRIAGTIALPFP